jgi:hypothetical protein
MGSYDNRRTKKMTQRRGQAKKKARIKRRAALVKEARKSGSGSSSSAVKVSRSQSAK